MYSTKPDVFEKMGRIGKTTCYITTESPAALNFLLVTWERGIALHLYFTTAKIYVTPNMQAWK
jgi:hypothetical protein